MRIAGGFICAWSCRFAASDASVVDQFNDVDAFWPVPGRSIPHLRAA